MTAPNEPPLESPSPVDDAFAPPARPRVVIAPPSGLALALLLPTLLVAMALAMRFLDVPVSTWVRDNPLPNWAKDSLIVLRFPGHFGFTLVLAGLIAWHARGHWLKAGLVLASGAIASLITGVLKWLFGRTRPFRGSEPFDWHPMPGHVWEMFTTKNLSFPSGDATLAFATASVVWHVCPRAWGAIAWAWAIVVACTRVLQGAHYPGDTMGGAIVGCTTGWAIVALAARRTRGPA